MRRPDQLVHSRARVDARYALLPLEGFPPSRLPGWGNAEVFVLAGPALGAGFVQYLVDLPAGTGGAARAADGVETFHYVLSGEGAFAGPTKQALTPGSYGLTPSGTPGRFTAQTDLRLLILQKQYEPSAEHPEATAFAGHLDDVAFETWADNPDSRLATLLPDDPAFDLALNVFTFAPGCGLPIVETHVMEHGLLFLEGRGLYYLGDRWMEVEADDFVWMGPYCPQSFCATGPTPSRYLYYKNVNREVLL